MVEIIPDLEIRFAASGPILQEDTEYQALVLDCGGTATNLCACQFRFHDDSMEKLLKQRSLPDRTGHVYLPHPAFKTVFRGSDYIHEKFPDNLPAWRMRCCRIWIRMQVLRRDCTVHLKKPMRQRNSIFRPGSGSMGPEVAGLPCQPQKRKVPESVSLIQRLHQLLYRTIDLSSMRQRNSIFRPGSGSMGPEAAKRISRSGIIFTIYFTCKAAAECPYTAVPAHIPAVCPVCISVHHPHTDSIVDNELRFFAWKRSQEWGYVIVPVYRKEERLYMGDMQFFPFDQKDIIRTLDHSRRDAQCAAFWVYPAPREDSIGRWNSSGR